MARRGDLNGWWRFGLVIVGVLWRVLFRLRIAGADHVPESGPAIVAANHLSALDGVVLALVTGERARRMTRFLVAAEFFRKATVAWALRLYRQIPLRRGIGDEDALDVAIRAVRAGALAGIFPEGRVGDDPEGELQRGRAGVSRIALTTGAPVIPVGIWGTQGRWPKAGLHLGRPWRRTVAISYGAPITPRGDPGSVEDVRLFTEDVMTEIAKQVADARGLAEA
ncbi:MAG TPA: lysophospholipid acyltransferase family protein [Actinomycetota bacterium]